MNKETIPLQLAADYARIVDNRCFAEMADIMWPEFTQKGPGFGAESCEVFINNLEFLRTYSRTFHLVGTQYGEWDGERYEGETYCVASHFYDKEGTEHKMDMGIRYEELIEIRNGTAKYLRRDLNVVWTEDKALGG